MNIKIDISTNANARNLLVRGVLVLVGAGAVTAVYSALMSVVGVFAAAIPYVAGALLFATLIGTFYFLLNLLKDMRQRARFRVSFWDAYTAVAVFTVMGYMATACLHAFQASGGSALDLWNKGALAAAGFTIFFGVAKGVAALWNDDNKSR